MYLPPTRHDDRADPRSQAPYSERRYVGDDSGNRHNQHIVEHPADSSVFLSRRWEGGRQLDDLLSHRLNLDLVSPESECSCDQ